MAAREQGQALGRDRGEVCEPQEVDQPDRDNETIEGLLSYEVDGGEVDGEEEADHRHQHTELEVVQQQAADYN